MKKFLMVPLVGGLLLASLQADEKDQIAQIRKWYAEIEGHKSLKKTEYKSGDEDPHTLALTRYVNSKGELKKLNLKASGEHGFSSRTFYFEGGKLFFVYEATEEWRFTGEKTADGQSETLDIGRQYRYYFHGGKCIKALMKTVQTKDGEKLRNLMKKAKNEPMVYHDTAPKVYKEALALSKITSREALEKFFSRP